MTDVVSGGKWQHASHYLMRESEAVHRLTNLITTDVTTARARRSVDWLVATCQAGMALTGLTWLCAGQLTFASIATVAVALCIVPRHVVASPTLREAIRAVSAVLLGAHVILGMGLGLYESSGFYDKLMHVLGTGAIAMLLILAIRDFCKRQRLVLPPPLMMWLVLCGAVSAGTAWELFEFSMDLTGLVTAQRGLQDTMLDLVADSVGGLIVVAGFAAWREIDEVRTGGANKRATRDIHQEG